MQQLSVNLGLATLPETKDKTNFSEFYKIYNAIKAVASALDSYVGVLQQDSQYWSVLTPSDTIHSQWMNRLYVKFSENVSLGDMCTLYNNAGTLEAKKAGGNPWAGDARGYCNVTGGVTAGNYGELILFGLHPHIVGATPGTLYYLSNTTSGAITATKPNTNGDKFQPIGFALSATELFFAPPVLVPSLDTTTLAISVLTP